MSFVPPDAQSVERSDGATLTPLNDGDLVNGIINDLRIAFAEQLRNGDNPANYRLVAGIATACSTATSSLINRVIVNGATSTIIPTTQPLPDGRYTLIACASLTSVSGIGLESDVAVSFTIDTTPPVLDLPADRTVEATGPGGAVVDFTASATDAISGTVPVTCVPASGSLFPLGVTTVNCAATDGAGNTARGSFTVTITPSSAPPVETRPYRLFVPMIAR